MQRGLHSGRVINEYQAAFGPATFSFATVLAPNARPVRWPSVSSCGPDRRCNSTSVTPRCRPRTERITPSIGRRFRSARRLALHLQRPGDTAFLNGGPRCGPRATPMAGPAAGRLFCARRAWPRRRQELSARIHGKLGAIRSAGSLSLAIRLAQSLAPSHLAREVQGGKGWPIFSRSLRSAHAHFAYHRRLASPRLATCRQPGAAHGGGTRRRGSAALHLVARGRRLLATGRRHTLVAAPLFSRTE